MQPLRPWLAEVDSNGLSLQGLSCVSKGPSSTKDAEESSRLLFPVHEDGMEFSDTSLWTGATNYLEQAIQHLQRWLSAPVF